MEPGVARLQREGYAAAVTGLWKRLGRALSELEALASDPDRLFEENVLDRLPSLQYALHAASELALGLRPPAGTETAHAELAAALAAARDATAELAEVLELGGADVACVLVPEWRGALFRVRLARLRISAPQPLPLEQAPEAPPRGAALAATLLSIGGALLFALGAFLSLWPVWGFGLALFAGAFLAWRP